MSRPNNSHLLPLEFLSSFSFARAGSYLALFLGVAGSASADITGMVFRENILVNGIQDPSEVQVAGALISAFDSAGNPAGTATTTTSGVYSITPTGTGPFRLEMTTIPVGFFAAPNVGGTTTRFVADGASENFALVTAGDLCEDNPFTFTPCYITGSINGSAGNLDAVVGFRYLDSGTTSPNKVILATHSEVGATWGAAHDPYRDRGYVSAVTRRHVSFGPGGPGAIYAIDLADPNNPSVSTLITLPNSDVNPGNLNFSESNRGITGGPNSPSTDLVGYASVGKTSIGDIDISADGGTLYAVALGSKDLVMVDLTQSPAVISGRVDIFSTITDPNLPSGQTFQTFYNEQEFRPWACKVDGGRVLVGAVSSGETNAPNSALQAFVLELNAAGTGFDVILSYDPRDVSRGIVWTQSTPTGANPNPDIWHDWTDINDWSGQQFIVSSPFSENYVVYPQPMLSDIEVIPNGDLILGFNDRMAMQGGFLEPDPTGAFDGSGYLVIGGGDIVRADLGAGGTYSVSTQEFYTGETFISNSGTEVHQETAFGSLAVRPDASDVMVTVYDPITGRFNAGGVKRLSNATGQAVASLEIYSADTRGVTFAKAAGLGDLEIACDTEIVVGDRVFDDVDQDGIQDPGEPGIPGVTLALYDSSGINPTILTTDANGDWISPPLEPGTDYCLVIQPSNFATNGALIGQQITTPNAGSDDTIDSDAVVITGQTGGLISQNGQSGICFNSGIGTNFDLDIGITPTPPSITGCVFNDGNDNGVQDANEVGIAGVTVTAYDMNGVLIGSVVTDANGLYSFPVTEGQEVRLEFTGFPSGLQPGNTGSQSMTDVVFVTEGENTKFGLNFPGVVCEVNPTLATTCFVQGDPTLPGSNGAMDPAVVAFANTASGQSIPKNTLALASEVGAVYGLANDARNSILYVSAVLKRHSGFGPAGSGGIYQIDYSDIDNPVVSTFTTVASVSGALPARNLPANGNVNSYDAAAFDQIGKASFGDIELSTDGQFLWATDLANSALLKINTTTQAVTSFPISVACTDSRNQETLSLNFTNLGGVPLPGFNGGPAFENFGNNSTQTTVTQASGFYAVTNASLPLNQWTKVNGDIYLRGLVGQNVSNGSRSIGIDQRGIPNGTYEVTFYFMEPSAYAGSGFLNAGVVSSTSPRIFDIILERGSSREVADRGVNSLSIVGGVRVPYTRTLNVQVTDGLLDIDFFKQSGRVPILAGYRIRRIDLAPAAAPSTDFRPWALKVTGDNVFVGGVCTAETSGLAEDIGAKVLRLNDPNAGGFSEILDVDMNYVKGLAWYVNSARGWYPWIDQLSDVPLRHRFNQNGVTFIQHPQPILTDIECAEDGSTFTLGFTDRFGYQMGYPNFAPDPTGTNPTLFAGQASGDTLQFRLIGTDYVQEGKPGFTDGLTSFDGSEFTIVSGFSSLSINSFVPAGQEFFSDGFFLANGDEVHPETSWGGLVTVEGSNGPEIALVSLDPFRQSSGGIRWFNPADGSLIRRAEIYESDISGSANTFGKATGLGDLEALCSADIIIGNFVWNDLDGDGTQDAGEPGIPNVKVILYGKDGTMLGMDVTDANGGYQFDSSNIPGGITANTDYIIVIDPAEFGPGGELSGTSPTLTDNNSAPGSDINDSDGEILTGLTGAQAQFNGAFGQCISVGDQNNYSFDFGVIQLLKVGNFIFIDANDDGLQAGENGLSGATVELFEADGVTPALNFFGEPALLEGTVSGDPQTTGGSGTYLFCDLAPGDYRVKVTPPAGFLPAKLPAITDVDDNPSDADSNGVPDPLGGNFVISDVFTLAAGTEPTNDDDEFDYTNTTVDFGFVPTLSVGNAVFKDVNGDGAFNPADGDTLVPGVTLDIYEAGQTPVDVSGGTVIASTTTFAAGTTDAGGNDISGCYLFTGLRPGFYEVHIRAENFLPGGALEGCFSTPGIDRRISDDNQGEDGVDAVDPATTGIKSDDFTIDFGAEPQLETGTCSGLNGPNALNPADDANTRLTIDFALVDLVCVGNLVFQDNNLNDVFDAGDAPITGASVSLFRIVDGVQQPAINAITGATLSPVVTGSTGLYEFCDLAPGTYVVRVDIPAGLVPVTKTNNTDLNNDDDGDGNLVPGQNYVESDPFVLSPDGEPTNDEALTDPDNDNSNSTVDFGFAPGALATPVGIGNVVFCDTDGDGIQDPGEPGIAGVTVTLMIPENTSVVPNLPAITVTDTTDSSGFYNFSSDDNVAALVDRSGETAMLIVDRTDAGLGDCNTPTTANVAGNDEIDSDGELQSGTDEVKISMIVPPANTRDDSNDFGFVRSLCIGNLVFLDTDRDGSGAGEPGLSGATISLFAADGVTVAQDVNGNNVASIVTGPNGLYEFCDLPPGDYVVQVCPPAPGTGASGNPGYIPTLQLNSADPDDNVDNDSNHELITVSGQPNCVRSQPVTLDYDDEPIGDSDVDTFTNNTVDFGFVEQVGVGNLVWIDKNGNGTFDDGIDERVPNVTVELYNEGANPLTETAPFSDITDANGNWLINTAPPGRYFAYIPVAEFQAGGELEGYLSSPGVEQVIEGAATDDSLLTSFPGKTFAAGEDGIDSPTPETTGIRTRNFNLRINREAFVEFGEVGDNFASDDTPSIATLDDDSIDLTKDFAFVQPMCLGNIVVIDDERDGTITGDDPLAGVTVELFRSDDAIGTTLTPATDVFGASVLPQITGTDGRYEFCDLTPGTYVVRFTPPAGYENVPNPVDPDPDTNPADTDNNGVSVPGERYTQSPPVTLEEGAEPLNDGTVSSDESDGNTNLTVDAAFAVSLGIGNLVYQDLNNNGVYDGSATDSPLADVTVNVYADANQDGVPDGGVIGSDVTDADGCYLIDGLDEGFYVVEIPAAEFATGGDLEGLISIPGNGLDVQVDDSIDENGIDSADPASTGIFSTTVQLSLDSEPFGGQEGGKDGTSDDGENDQEIDLTVDFGFRDLTDTVGVGNLVFMDANNNGSFDSGSDMGIPGVTVNLIDADAANGAVIATTVTDADGCYSFTGLEPGNYLVLLPPSDFATGGPLEGKSSVAGNGDGNALDDSGGSPVAGDDNGIDSLNPATEGISSTVISLTLGGQTSVETGKDAGGDDPNENNHDNTVDFAFTDSLGGLGNLVFIDLDNDGRLEPGDTPLDGVVVELYLGTQTPGTDLPIATTVTADGGCYLFTGLQNGDYLVHIPAINFDNGEPLDGFLSSTGEELTSGDDQAGENGVDAATPATTGVSSEVITLDTAGSPTSLAESGKSGSSDNATPALDLAYDLTIDFAFTEGKTDTFAGFVAANAVFLGENDAPGDDPDGDMFTNAQEYALCLKPDTGLKVFPDGRTPNFGFQLVSDDNGDTVDACFSRPIGITDVTYIVESSTDGQTWTTLSTISPGAALPVGVIATDNTNGSQKVTLEDLESATFLNSPSGLVRLKTVLTTPTGTVTDVTKPSGFQEYCALNICTTFANPFLEPCEFVGTVDGVNAIGTGFGQDIALTSSIGTESFLSLDQTAKYYIEVLSASVVRDEDGIIISTPDFTGHRFDVERFTQDNIIIEPDNNLYSLEAPFNTLLETPNLTGAMVVLRKHRTIADLFPVDNFNPGTDAMSSGNLLVFNRETQSYETYQLDANGGSPEWQNAAGDSVMDLIVPPGEGYFTHNRGGVDESCFLQFGEVRTSATILPLSQGYNFVAATYPLAQSPAGSGTESRLMTDASGFTGSPARSRSDQIQTWRDDTAAPGSDPHLCYDALFYAQGGSGANAIDNWLFTDDPDPTNIQDAALLFQPNRSVIICRQTDPLPEHLVPSPIDNSAN